MVREESIEKIKEISSEVRYLLASKNQLVSEWELVCEEEERLANAFRLILATIKADYARDRSSHEIVLREQELLLTSLKTRVKLLIENVDDNEE